MPHEELLYEHRAMLGIDAGAIVWFAVDILGDRQLRREDQDHQEPQGPREKEGHRAWQSMRRSAN